MLTGSFASSLQGEPRATHDVDLVVALTADSAARLARAFPPPEYYLSQESISEVIEFRTMFNLINTRTSDEVDFWILTDEPFDQSRFARRKTEAAFGLDVQVSSPEDTIMAKLHWAKRSGGSEKQFGDALGVYEVQRGDLDLDYLELWAQKLDVTEMWQRLREEAEPLA